MEAAEKLDVLESDTKALLTVLCVDDEPNILTSLKRALRKQPFKLITAESGPDALAALKEISVDLVISDMRMPGMTGAELLTQVYQNYPETMRILLTGYSDMESTVSAINDGKIHQYISKPWDNDELVFSIDRALDQKLLQDENRALTELIKKQNEELRELNQNLEAKVAARTKEITEASNQLQGALTKLNESYQQAISVFSSLIELREGDLSGHGQNVANLSAEIARKLSLTKEQCSDLRSAALLHDIGKIGIPDELCHKPYIAMNSEERETYESHACVGQAALLSIPALDNTGNIIRSHHENFDGTGFPDRLSGNDIPVGARIMAITTDFDDLQTGILTGEQCSKQEAAQYIQAGSGTRYDPDLVSIFRKIVKSDAYTNSAPKVMKVNYRELREGMILAKNITSNNGLLMLREGQILDQLLIERIHSFVDDTQSSTIIVVTGESAITSSGNG